MGVHKRPWFVYAVSIILGSFSGLIVYFSLGNSAQQELQAGRGYSAHVDIKTQQHMPAWNIPLQYRPELVLQGTNTGGNLCGLKGSSLRFHWVITTCPHKRKNWGRFLSSTLLSATLNGLCPYTINIVLCEPYDAKQPLPALLSNLKYASNVYVWGAPRNFPINTQVQWGFQLKQKYWRTAMQAFTMPGMLNATNLPMLLTEDDVFFSPDAHTRLSAAVRQVQQQVPAGDDYYITAYEPSGPRATNQITGVLQPGADELDKTGVVPPVTIRREVWWGFQAVFVTPGMAHEIVKHFMNITDPKWKRSNQDEVYKGHADWRVMLHLGLNLKANEPGSKYHSFRAMPSLVQHTGTTSATFGRNETNPVFHSSVDFPYRLSFPGFEPPSLW